MGQLRKPERPRNASWSVLVDNMVYFNSFFLYVMSSLFQSGHCCESGDLMTPAAGEPNVIEPRLLSGPVRIGDLVCIDGSGAYCSSMSAKNYNSFPEAPEVLIRSKTNKIDLIRR